MNIIKRKDEKCSQCGLSVEKMRQMVSKENDANAFTRETLFKQSQAEQTADSQNVNEVEQIEVSAMQAEQENAEQKPKRHKHKKKKVETPHYTVDENGDYNIDTNDVTFLEGVETPTHSVRKARGEFKQEKLKWWEIYKWADRMLAKRKIMKEVNKASYTPPEGISRTTTTVLCVLFGWLGAHNFYAKNYKRGWTIVAFDIIISLVLYIKPLFEFMGVFVGGGLGFVMVAMWFYDIVSLIFNKYKYRISKEKFISNLNVETRAKLGKKYIDLDRVAFKEKEQKRLDKLNAKKNKKRTRN